MRKILPIAVAMLFIVGCATQSRVVYNTLAGVEATTTGAFNAYLDLVVKGALPTNSVPAVSRDYDLFKLTWSAAVTVAQWNTNAPAAEPVIQAARQVINDINVAKGVQ